MRESNRSQANVRLHCAPLQDGLSLMDYAAAYGAAEVLSVGIRQLGADVNDTDVSGGVILGETAMRAIVIKSESLSQNPPFALSLSLSLQPDDGTTLAMYAAMSGSASALQAVLSAKPTNLAAEDNVRTAAVLQRTHSPNRIAPPSRLSAMRCIMHGGTRRVRGQRWWQMVQAALRGVRESDCDCAPSPPHTLSALSILSLSLFCLSLLTVPLTGERYR